MDKAAQYNSESRARQTGKWLGGKTAGALREKAGHGRLGMLLPKYRTVRPHSSVHRSLDAGFFVNFRQSRPVPYRFACTVLLPLAYSGDERYEARPTAGERRIA
jgi:hypothetical protein